MKQRAQKPSQDPAKLQRVMQALLKMVKLDIQELKRAAKARASLC
jgi:hypothetical protein